MNVDSPSDTMSTNNHFVDADDVWRSANVKTVALQGAFSDSTSTPAQTATAPVAHAISQGRAVEEAVKATNIIIRDSSANFAELEIEHPNLAAASSVKGSIKVSIKVSEHRTTITKSDIDSDAIPDLIENTNTLNLSDPATAADEDTIQARRIRRPTGTNNSSLRAKKRRDRLPKLSEYDNALETIHEPTEDLILGASRSAVQANSVDGKIFDASPIKTSLKVKMHSNPAANFTEPSIKSPPMPSSTPPIHELNLKSCSQQATNTDEPSMKSPSIPSSPPSIHSLNIKKFSQAGTMANTNYDNDVMNEVVAKTGSLGLHPSGDIPSPADFEDISLYDVSSNLRRNKDVDVLSRYRNASEDEEGDKENELPALPPPTPSPIDDRRQLTPEKIDDHFAKMGEIGGALHNILSRAGKDEFRLKRLKKILSALDAILVESLNYHPPDHPLPNTDYAIDFDLQYFASVPMCPWMYLRTLIHSHRFRELIHRFEDKLLGFIDDVNSFLSDPRTGMNKRDFLSTISKVLIMNMAPRLYLEDSAIPKLELILEKVDSLYDPVSLVPDEEEPLELGLARGMWTHFAFIEKIAAMKVANNNYAYISNRSHVNSDNDEDGLPYVFFTEHDHWLRELMKVAVGITDEMKTLFSSLEFGHLANAFEKDINNFLYQMMECGATCRKKVIVFAVAQFLADSLGVQKEADAGEVAGGSVGENVIAYDENGVPFDQNGVQLGAAGESELLDAMGYVFEQGDGCQNGDREVDGDGDATMGAFV